MGDARTEHHVDEHQESLTCVANLFSAFSKAKQIREKDRGKGGFRGMAGNALARERQGTAVAPFTYAASFNRKTKDAETLPEQNKK